MKRKWGIECPECKSRIFSWYTHDFRYCLCKNVFIDGGNDYTRYSHHPTLGKPRAIYWTKKDGK